MENMYHRSTTQFGSRLKFYRLRCGLTQQQVADAINLNRTTYTKYETGVSEPSHQVLAKIVAIFGVTYDDLFADDDSLVTNVADSGLWPSRLSRDENEIIAYYRLLSKEQKQEFREKMDSLSSIEKK